MQKAVQSEQVRVGPRGLAGELTWPSRATGLVLFAHGSGSTHSSPRNRFVAGVLHEHRLATLLFDLLSEDEASERSNVFDITLLARRLTEAMDWLRERLDSPGGRPGGDGAAPRRVGLFGASTGAAAALQAAALRPST